MLPARPITTPTTAPISCQRPRRQLAATATNDAALETKFWLGKVARCCLWLLVGRLNNEFGAPYFHHLPHVPAVGRIAVDLVPI